MGISLKKIGAILGVALVLALAGFFSLSRILATQPGTPSPLSVLLHPKRNAVEMADQQPASEVQVSAATLTDPGYVVIYDDEEGPGKMLGASERLPKGVSRNLQVRLAQPLAPGYYYAVLEQDAGQGVFDPAKDAPLRDAHGEIVMARFLAADDPTAAPPSGS